MPLFACPRPRLLDLIWIGPCRLIRTPPQLAAHAPIKGGSAFLCKRCARSRQVGKGLQDPAPALFRRAAGLRLCFPHTSSFIACVQFLNFLQDDYLGWGDALLPPAQARGGLQRPAAHCHSGILVPGRQLPAHLAWDPWPLGKRVLRAPLRGILEAHVVGERAMRRAFLGDSGQTRLREILHE